MTDRFGAAGPKQTGDVRMTASPCLMAQAGGSLAVDVDALEPHH